jgi:hypothetical protein
MPFFSILKQRFQRFYIISYTLKNYINIEYLNSNQKNYSQPGKNKHIQSQIIASPYSAIIHFLHLCSGPYPYTPPWTNLSRALALTSQYFGRKHQVSNQPLPHSHPSSRASLSIWINFLLHHKKAINLPQKKNFMQVASRIEKVSYLCSPKLINAVQIANRKAGKAAKRCCKKNQFFYFLDKSWTQSFTI